MVCEPRVAVQVASRKSLSGIIVWRVRYYNWRGGVPTLYIPRRGYCTTPVNQHARGALSFFFFSRIVQFSEKEDTVRGVEAPYP